MISQRINSCIPTLLSQRAPNRRTYMRSPYLSPCTYVIFILWVPLFSVVTTCDLSRWAAKISSLLGVTVISFSPLLLTAKRFFDAHLILVFTPQSKRPIEPRRAPSSIEQPRCCMTIQQPFILVCVLHSCALNASLPMRMFSHSMHAEIAELDFSNTNALRNNSVIQVSPD